MEDRHTGLSRRGALKTIGAATGAAGVSGLASASPGEKVEVNVGFANGAGARAFRRQADEVIREFDFDAGTARMPRAAADALDDNPNVRYVETNGTVQALGETLPWGVDRVDAEVAAANGDTGNGADIAILDTGIDSDHPDLQANLGKGAGFVTCDASSCSFSGNGNDCHTGWDDDNDHGTHVAGTADAVDNSRGVVGVATAATLHAVKVLDGCGAGSYSDVAAGVEYVANEGWDVANMSLGGSSGSSVLRDACTYAANSGVFLVASAGNSGPCSDCVGYPAAYSEVFAVTATTASDTLLDTSCTGSQVDLAAPGRDVLSTVSSGTARYSGTSMAAAHVAGAAGLLAAKGATRSQIESALKSSAEDIGLGPNEQGAGLLDVAAALGYDSSDN